MPGLLPNLKIAPEFERSAPARAATTLSVAGSPFAGGARKRPTGYAIATAVDTKPIESSASRNARRSNVASAGGASGLTAVPTVPALRVTSLPLLEAPNADLGRDHVAHAFGFTLIRASTMRQPSPGAMAITGFRSRSTISGTSTDKREIRCK